MVCINSKQLYSRGGKPVIQVDLVATDTPNPLPTSLAGIEGLPGACGCTDAQIAAGSTLYVVSTGDVYMANEAGAFVLQS